MTNEGKRMSQEQPLNENSPAVQTHLTMMQGVINRMAENSRSCKVWCVTLVAAVLVLVARTGGAAACLDCVGTDAVVLGSRRLLSGAGATVP